ncbi:MAG: VOC family protein [Myxococcales bacterium]|nr:VOC family protein [Myxococcales bacterium]
MPTSHVRFDSVSVVMPVSNWPAALSWYQNVLGCEVRRVDLSIGEFVELRFGRQRFSLCLDWGDPRIPLVDGSRDRAPLLMLEVRSLALARKRLAARGATVKRTPTGLFTLVDPFGNELLLMQAPRVRQSAAALARATQYLSRAETFRLAVDEKMKASGVTSFENLAARRAFLRKHGLRQPRP